MDKAVMIDRAKNRIYIHFDGFMDVGRAQQLHDAYRDAIKRAKPGYTVLTYAAGYKPGGPEVQEIVARMTRMAGETGCSKVARVIGANPLGAMQIRRLAESGGKYESQHFKTEQEAEEYLDKQ